MIVLDVIQFGLLGWSGYQVWRMKASVTWLSDRNEQLEERTDYLKTNMEAGQHVQDERLGEVEGEHSRMKNSLALLWKEHIDYEQDRAMDNTEGTE